MSTFTKIFVVLLTLSSIFLCGIVVTYVGSAENYKQKNTELQSDKNTLREKVNDLTKQLEEKNLKSNQLEDKLNTEVTSLKTQIKELQTNISNVEREKAALVEKVNSWASITKDFTQTTDTQGQLLKSTLDELNKVKTDQVKERKEYNETSTALVEKMAVIDALDAEKKRLLEEKTDLQNKLDQLLQPAGKTVVAPVPVTPKIGEAKPAPAPLVTDLSLQGVITAMDLKNSLVSISLGSADGVREGMKFHITRGDEFVCDVLIIDVDAKEAVGVLDLVQQQPKVGDNASTNL